MPPIHIELLTPPLDQEMAQQMQIIYDASFPREERSPFAVIAESIARGERLLFLAWGGATVTGFAIVLPLDVAGVYLLDYLAVAEALRGRGVGTALVAATREHLTRLGAVGIILEVEPPEAENTREREHRQRRIAFYQSNGARLFDKPRPYWMAADNEMGLMEMRLMWLPLDPAYPLPDATLLAACIVNLFVEVYSRLPDDPVLGHMLAGLS